MKARAFTLIELLIVVGIVGILAAVILASLSGARGSGSDAGVKGDLSTIQVQGVLYYSVADSYGVSNTGSSASCTAANTVFRDTGTTVGDDIERAVAAAKTHASGGAAELYCRSNSTSFLVAGRLTTGKYWCIDNLGASIEKTSAPGGSATNCSY